MKFILQSTLAFLVFLSGSQAQTGSIVRASVNKAIYQIDGGPKHGWNVNPKFDPDILDIYIPEGKTVSVTFSTDLESQVFKIEGGKILAFTVQVGDVAAHTQIVGKRLDNSAWGLRSIVAGNPNDVTPEMNGPWILLQGKNDRSGMQQLINKVRGCTDCRAKLDVVFVRMALFNYQTTFPGFNSMDAIDKWADESAAKRASEVMSLDGVNSVQNISIKNVADLNSLDLADAIRKAEVVFIDDGKFGACDYSTRLRGTKFVDEVKALYDRGGGIGSAGAGRAVQGGFLYDQCGGRAATGNISSMSDSLALAMPFNKVLTSGEGVFIWGAFRDTIISSDIGPNKLIQLEPTLVLMVRRIGDNTASITHAIGIAPDASVLVDRNSRAQVTGDGPVYFVTADHKPEEAVPGETLTYSNFKIWKLSHGKSFDLAHWPLAGFYNASVKWGGIDGDLYRDN